MSWFKLGIEDEDISIGIFMTKLEFADGANLVIRLLIW